MSAWEAKNCELWDVTLSKTTFAVAGAPLEGMEFSPNELVFGHNWKTPIEEEWGSGDEVDLGSFTAAKFVGGKRAILQAIRESVMDAVQANKERSANRVNVDRIAVSYKPGQLVGRRLKRQSSKEDNFNAKLAYMAAGPFVVQQVSDTTGGQTLGLSLLGDPAVTYFLTPKDVFPWKADEDDRPGLLTLAREAESRLLSARPARSIRRVVVPRADGGAINEEEQVQVRDGGLIVDELDQWRSDDQSVRRLRGVLEAASDGRRFVFVRRRAADVGSGTGEVETSAEADRGILLRLARIIDVTAPGVVGAHVGVHYYEVQQVSRTEAGITSSAWTWSSVRTGEKWDVDSPANTYIALPLWRRGGERRAAPHHDRGYTPDEDVVPLQYVVGDGFALVRGEGDRYPRVIPKELFRIWKDKSTIPRAVRDAIVLRSSRAGNRSDPAMSELRALTYDQIKALSLEQARVACAARGLPTEGTLDGKVKTTRKPELKALLRVWVDENGREPAGAAGDVRPAKKSRRVVASQPSEGR